MAKKPSTNLPPYHLCVGKKKDEEDEARIFTQVGAGWMTRNGSGVKIKLDLTLLLGPSDELYLLPNRKFKEQQSGSNTTTTTNT